MTQAAMYKKNVALMLMVVQISVFTGSRAQLTTEGCGKTKGCFGQPETCTKSGDCNFLVTWTANTTEKTVSIEFTAKGTHWVAVGLNNDKSMIGVRGEICIKDGATFKLEGVNATKKERPQFPSTPNSVVQTKNMFANSYFTCSYKRSFDAGATYQRPLNQMWHIIVAHGNELDSGAPRYHGRGNYAMSSMKFNLASTSYKSNMKESSAAMVTLNGVLITLLTTMAYMMM